MKYPVYRADAACPKCLFPTAQMYRLFKEDKHKVLVNKEVLNCNVKGEHIHLECACGHELIFRPFDYNKKLKKKGKTK